MNVIGEVVVKLSYFHRILQNHWAFFYLNLTKSILGLMRFKFCLCDGPRSL